MQTELQHNLKNKTIKKIQNVVYSLAKYNVLMCGINRLVNYWFLLSAERSHNHVHTLMKTISSFVICVQVQTMISNVINYFICSQIFYWQSSWNAIPEKQCKLSIQHSLNISVNESDCLYLTLVELIWFGTSSSTTFMLPYKRRKRFNSIKEATSSGQ